MRPAEVDAGADAVPPERPQVTRHGGAGDAPVVLEPRHRRKTAGLQVAETVPGVVRRVKPVLGLRGEVVLGPLADVPVAQLRFEVNVVHVVNGTFGRQVPVTPTALVVAAGLSAVVVVFLPRRQGT